MSFRDNKEYTGHEVVAACTLSLITGLAVGFCVLGNMWATHEHNKCSETVTELMSVYEQPHYNETEFDCEGLTHGIC